MKDNELLVFTGGKERFVTFLQVLKNQKKTDVWRRCYTKEMKVHPLYDNPISLPLLREELNIPCDDDFIISCMEGYKPIMLEFPLEKMTCIPLRSTAFASLCGRGHVSGSVLQKMSIEDFSTVMNICLQQWGDSSLVLYRDNKISAVHSGDSNDYSVLPMYDLMKAMEDGLEELCNESGRSASFDFAGGFLSHSLCSASFFLYDNELAEYYKSYLEKMGYEKTDMLHPVVKFSSSDVGICGANITPALSNGKQDILIGSPLTLSHKNKANIDMFKTNVKGIYALFRSTLKDFDRLEEIVLDYPERCFINLCKKIKVGNKYMDAFIDFQNTRGSKTNALELYFAICEIIRYMKNDNEPENKIFREQEKIARILSLNIKAYDKPELENLDNK